MTDFRVKGTERVANLLVTLVNAPTKGITKAALLESVAGYTPADERTFERDKKTLVDAGIALKIRQDEVFTNETYYSVDLASSDLKLDSLEAAVVLAAIRMWSDDAGWNVSQVESKVPDAAPIDVPQWHVSGTESLTGFMEALVAGRSVSFKYRKGSGETEVRHVDPWRLRAKDGAWYLLGYDHDRDRVRTFRVSRVIGEPTQGAVISHPASDAVVDAFEIAPLVAIAPGSEHALRMRGTRRPADERTPEGWQNYLLEEDDFLAWLGDLVECGPNVVVLAPNRLRQEVIAHFKKMVDDA